MSNERGDGKEGGREAGKEVRRGKRRETGEEARVQEVEGVRKRRGRRKWAEDRNRGGRGAERVKREKKSRE